ncbi:MAG: TfoX/Sxy family protein [Acidimicrobiia bacterium]
MPYDKHLVARVRARLNAVDGITETTLFDGWGATLDGAVVLGVVGDDLVVRVGEAHFLEALAAPGARPFVADGLGASEWVAVAPEIASNARVLTGWVQRAIGFARGPAVQSSRRRSTS